MTRMTNAIGAATFALALAMSASAFALQHSGTSSAGMPTMMNQCAQMRQQMQQNRSAAASADMQRMMAQCDQMDRMHGARPNPSPGDGLPSTPNGG